MTNNQQDAVQDCKYALSLSEAALQGHFKAWLNDYHSQMTEDDKEYSLTIKDIASKLHSNACLLKEDAAQCVP